MEAIDLSLGLADTHVLVTGGAGLIGRRTVSAFLEAGCKVSVLDVSSQSLAELPDEFLKQQARYPKTSQLSCFEADITCESSLQKAFENARGNFGPIQCCVALASLDLSVLDHHKSIIDMPVQQFRKTIDVNVTGTFLTAKIWLSQLAGSQDAQALKNKSLLIVGSESGSFGERTNADYATSKSAVQNGLLQSLKADVPRTVPAARINAIVPGPVDTARFREECKADANQLWLDARATTALGHPVPMAAVAKGIVFLASENWSSHIHGQVLPVDSGKQGKVMWMQGEQP